MERVPYEVRLQIIKSISYPDKLACTFVCKEWNRLTRPYLFRKDTTRDALDLTNAITFFEKFPEFATHVLHFEIKTCVNALLYVPQIQKLFPKLKKLELSGKNGLKTLQSPVNNTCVAGTWHNLKELNTYEILTLNNSTMAELVLSRLCPELTKLFLDITFESHNALLRSQFTRIVNLLQNAPRLSHLEISSIPCSLPYINAIHQNATKLDSLKLSNIALDTENIAAGPLEPVQLTDLHVQFCDAPDNIVPILDYFVKKYTGLTSFSVTINDSYSAFDDFPTTELETALLPLFSHCPNLEYYDQMFTPLTPTILEEMERCGIELKGITLYIDYNTVKDQCEILNDSYQSESINHVSLYLQDIEDDDIADQYMELNVKQALEALDDLSNFDELSIIPNDTQLCLSDVIEFLDMAPYLLKLSVSKVNIILGPEHFDPVKNMMLLQTLEIRDMYCEWKYHEAINVSFNDLLAHCPDLEEVILDMSLYLLADWDDLGCVKLDFRQNTILKSLVINAKRNREQYSITQETPYKSGYYVYDEEKNVLLEKESFEPGGYYTTILLSQPVIFNSCQI